MKMSLIEMIYIWLAFWKFSNVRSPSFHLAFQFGGSVHCYGKYLGRYFVITELLLWFIFPVFHIMLQPDTWWQKRVKTGNMKLKARSVLSCSTTFFSITVCLWPITFLDGLILDIYHLKLLGETRCPQRWTAFPEISNRAALIRNLCLFSEHTSENIFICSVFPSSLSDDLIFLKEVKLLSQDKFLTGMDASDFHFYGATVPIFNNSIIQELT